MVRLITWRSDRLLNTERVHDYVGDCGSHSPIVVSSKQASFQQ